MDSQLRGICPQCGSRLRIPPEWVGQVVRCRKCQAVIRLKTPLAVTAPVSSGTLTSHGNNGTVHPTASPVVIPPAAGLPHAVPAAIPLAPPHGTGAPPAYPPGLVAAPIGSPAVAAYPMTTLAPEQPLIQKPLRYRRPSLLSRLISLAVCLLLSGGLIAGGIYAMRYFEQLGQPSSSDIAATPTVPEPAAPQPSRPATAAYPRRLLMLCIDNYMFLNPLTAAPPGQGDRLRSQALRWAFTWRIPLDRDNSQVFLLTDTFTGQNSPVPVKPVLQGTYASFLATSRPQDRIIVYFSGHALYRNGAAYIAPIEADPDELDTFILLNEFYNQLKECRATQKVVVWDVCRFNPERGVLRPGSEPMSEELHRALLAAPSGVQVIVTCQPGQNALEFNSITLEGPRPQTLGGSAFLIAARLAAERRRGVSPEPVPDDPLPVEEWVQQVQEQLNGLLEQSRLGRKQTLAVGGSRPTQLVAANPAAEPAQPVVFPPPPRTAPPALIAGIASECALPPIKDDIGQDNLSNFPFDETLLAAYQADIPVQQIATNKNMYPLRAAVLEAFEVIREVWAGNPAAGGTKGLPNVIKAPITDETKKMIADGLDFYAIGIAKLELIDSTLDNLEGMRANEPKRWQAHFDYARAAVKTRLAFLQEYNKVMGNVRTESLPPLDPKLGQNQYRLASSDRLRSGPEVRKLLEDARQIYAQIIAEHKGTPWAILAKREKNLSIGLVWQPSSDKPADE